MTGKFAAVCLAGLLGSLFVGYCIYFDRKRRSDPNYKKKVLARRRAAAKQQQVVDLRDPKVREEFLMTEMLKANQMLMEGNIEDGIGHLINFVQFSGNPRATLVTLQQTLPPPIFNLLARTYAALMQMKAKSLKEKGKEEADVD